VRGEVHIQGIENFWSLLKRGLNGTNVAVEPFHLSRYVDEQIFRFNNLATKDNPLTDADRFVLAMSDFGSRIDLCRTDQQGRRNTPGILVLCPRQTGSFVILSNDYLILRAERGISPIQGIELPVEYGTLTAISVKGKIVPDKMYTFQGKMFPGQPVEMETSSEPFSQYTLADGTTVKVKTVLLEAVRLDTYTDTGDPVYQFQFQQILGIIAPDSLKRKAQ
jgi:ISXO2-like transposase domain